MRRVYRNIHGKIVTDEVKYTLDYLSQNPGTKLYIGSDSQKKRKVIQYALVLAYRKGTTGAHFIYTKWDVPKKGALRGDALIVQRLQNEIQCSIEFAERLKEHSINVHQIDLDLNDDPSFKSNNLVQMGVGWARGLGYNVTIKPDEQVATKAANHIVNG